MHNSQEIEDMYERIKIQQNFLYKIFRLNRKMFYQLFRIHTTMLVYIKFFYARELPSWKVITQLLQALKCGYNYTTTLISD